MSYLILDIETIPNGQRMAAAERSCYPEPDGQLTWETDSEVLKRMHSKHCQDVAEDLCFTPSRYHDPVAWVMLAVDDYYQYQGHREVVSDDPAKVVREFWESIGSAHAQTYVTFNGKRFDFPVMEIGALIHGLSTQGWHTPSLSAKSWENPRNKWNHDIHLDLYSYLADPGSTGGGLSFYARTAGLPGKLDVSGASVEKLMADGEHQRVLDYCAEDVLNTYGLLMAVGALRGQNVQVRGPVFEQTMEKLLAGRKYADRFISAYRADGLF